MKKLIFLFLTLAIFSCRSPEEKFSNAVIEIDSEIYKYSGKMISFQTKQMLIRLKGDSVKKLGDSINIYEKDLVLKNSELLRLRNVQRQYNETTIAYMDTISRIRETLDSLNLKRTKMAEDFGIDPNQNISY